MRKIKVVENYKGKLYNFEAPIYKNFLKIIFFVIKSKWYKNI